MRPSSNSDDFIELTLKSIRWWMWPFGLGFILGLILLGLK